MGYVVTEADSGRAALAILERGDPCDLMIADLVMIGLSGSGYPSLGAAHSTRSQSAVLQRLCRHVEVRGRDHRRNTAQEAVHCRYPGRSSSYRSSAGGSGRS